MTPLRWLARHRRDRRANVLLIVGLAAVPLIGMVALAIDVGRTSMVKAALDRAADSAALLATTAASNAWKAGDQNAIAGAIAAAQARFQAQSAQQADALTGPVSVGLIRNGGLFNATVSYTAQESTTFAQVLGITMLPIQGHASASLSLNPYVDIQVLMDVSSSMTVAATPRDIAALEALTAQFQPAGPLPGNVERGVGCGFACHWSTTNVDYYRLAINNHVQLRITVLQDAVTSLINTIAGLDKANTFELGLYTFSQTFNTINPLSYDIASELPSVATILPDINDCSSNCPDTYFSNAMGKLAALDATLPQQGTQVPQRFLFIVSDGVYDQYAANGARQIGPFKPADCDAIKALGISILVLYTPYTPLPDNAFYVQNVQPISPQIQPDLQACASSSSYFFVASDAADIKTQLQNMLQLVVRSTSHLTN